MLIRSMHWKGWWSSWVVSDPSLSLEQQCFQGLCLLGGVWAIFVIPVNSFQDLNPWVNRLVFGFGLVSLTLAWAARRGCYYKKTLLLAFVVCLDLNWFPNGGSQSSIGLSFFAAALFLVFFFEGIFRYAGLGLLMVNIFGLHIAELVWPNLLHPVKNATGRLLDISTGNLISLSGCVLMLGVILTGFKRREKRLCETLQALKVGEVSLVASEIKGHDPHSLMHSILESPHGVVIYTLDVNYCYMTFTSAHQDVMKAIWGVEIVHGMNMLEAIQDPAQREKSKGNFDRALAGESLTLTEEYGNLPLRTFYENRYGPIVDCTGKVYGVTVIVIDTTEGKLAEEARRVSEEKFTKIFQMSPDAIDLVRTTDRVSLLINYAFTQLFGYTPEDFIGRPLLPNGLDLWVNLEDRARLMASLKAHGEVRGFEAPLRRKDGSIFVAEIATSSLEINGEPYHLSITHDITERKILQEALEKSKNLLQQVLDTLPIPVYCKDQEERYSLCNRTFQKFMERTENDLLGKTSLDISPPVLGEIYRQSDRLLLETGKTLQYETRVEVASGLRQIVVTKNVMRDPSGDITGLVGAFLDITERKQTEEALRTSEQQLLMTQELGHTGSWLYNPETSRIMGSTEALRIFGFPPVAGELNIEEVEVCIPERERVHQALLALVAEGREYHIEYALNPADGSPQRIVASVAKLEKDGQGNPPMVLGFIQDITERKQAEDERRKFAERIHQAQKLESLGILVAGVAHNMNNVLAVIMGVAALREELAIERDDLKSYKIIGKACRRGSDVVKSLIQFARPSLSEQLPLDLHVLITEVGVLLEHTTRNRIEIIAALAQEPMWIQGDAGNLNLAIMNLCLNSLDAMPNGGTLTFRTAISTTGWVEVTVEDSGEGMTPEVLAHVLEPFFTTKEVGKGTGLGLSMTHGVIKAHGGTMEISSSPGRGTTVRLQFPRIHGPALQQTTEA